MAPVKGAIRNLAWGTGLRARNLAKRAGVLGPLEAVVVKLGLRFIKPPSSETEAALPFGMRMVMPPSFPSARSYAAGLYEQEVVSVFTGIIKEGMTVVDLGANVGYYTLLSSALVGSAGRVYAFEADPQNYAYQMRNIQSNGCRNVTAVGKGVAQSSGSMPFFRDPYGAEGFLTKDGGNAGSISVETISLDDFFAAERWPTVDLVKMDIEGGEMSALLGMRELSRRNPRMRVITEFNVGSIHRAQATPEALGALLMELGFCRGYIIERRMKRFSLKDGLPKTRATYDLLLTKE